MKLRKKVSWLMGLVQQSLLPHLQRCSDNPITEQEEKLVSLLELIEVEKYVRRTASKQWLGRKLLARRAIARASSCKIILSLPDNC